MRQTTSLAPAHADSCSIPLGGGRINHHSIGPQTPLLCASCPVDTLKTRSHGTVAVCMLC